MTPNSFTNTDIQNLLTAYTLNESKVINQDSFKEDVFRFIYVFRIIKRYQSGKDLNRGLLINHLIILYNVFGPLTTDIFLKNVTEDTIAEVYSVLYYMQRLPETYHSKVSNPFLKLLSEDS